MRTNRRLGVLAAAVAGAIGGANLAGAATHTWNGGGTASNPGQPPDFLEHWRTPSFWNDNNEPPMSGTSMATTELVFGGSDPAGDLFPPYTSYNDAMGVMELNVLRFNSTSLGTNTLAVHPEYPGGSLRFVNNGTTAPRITQDTGGAFNVDMPIEFAANTNFTGGGTGRVTLLGPLSGTGALSFQGGHTVIAGNARIETASALNIGNAGGGGTLSLDHGGSVQNRLADTLGITFGVGGGNLVLLGNAGGSTETVGNVTVNAGANRIQASSVGGAAATISTGTFTRNGGVVDFVGTGGTLGGGATGPRIVWANAPTLVNGIIGGWATANGTDFASYGANGVAAYSGGYTNLPASDFSPTAIYQSTGNLTLTGGGDVFALKLNPSAAQTINLGANDLNITGGILKTGAGATTVNGTGTLGSGTGELVLHVNQGSLTLNAPFAATRWTKAGTGALTISPSGNTAWQTVGFSGPVTMNVTTDTTVSAQMGGNGSLTKTGAGKLTLTGAGSASGWSGGVSINGGTVELLATSTAQSVNLAGGNSYLGSSGTININNGSTLKVTTAQNGNTTGNINLTRAVTFNSGGGVLDLNNTVGGTMGGGTNTSNFGGTTVVGGGNSGFTLTSNATGSNAAVIRFNGGQAGFSDPTNFANWNAGGNVLRVNSYAGSGPIRIELTKAGTFRQGTGGGGVVTINNPFTLAGQVGGDPSSGPAGTISPSTTTNTGHVASDNFAVVNYANGLNLEGALQVSAQGASRAMAGNITLRGTASGSPAYVAFNGRGTGTNLSANINAPGGGAEGQNPLYLNYNGTNAAGTLTIQDGAIASMDLRIRTDQARSSGVFMEGATVIQSGGTLRFTQSSNAGSATGYSRVNNTITGQGSTDKDSVVDLYLPAADTASNAARLNGVQFNGTNVAVVVNGTGLGGLRVNGLARPGATLNNGTNVGAFTDVASDLKIGNLLTPERLAGLTGTGGYLTPAAQGATFTLPSAGEWASSVPVGLRATNSNASGTDVALPSNGTWSHNLHVDADAALGVDGVSVNAGTTSGLGTLVGNVRFGGSTVVKPGAAAVAGSLAVAGNATFDTGSALVSEITSATSSGVKATGNASLTGATLTVTPTAVPAGAGRWEVLVADSDNDGVGTLTGRFATATLPADEATALPRLWSLVYEPKRVTVGFTIGGDADYSGTVNFTDLLSLAKNYNQSNRQWIEGDFSRDGTVNFTDLLSLAKNYNKSVPVPSEVAGATAEFNADLASAFAQVPEPGSLGLIGLGLTALVGGRRRRRA